MTEAKQRQSGEGIQIDEFETHLAAIVDVAVEPRGLAVGDETNVVGETDIVIIHVFSGGIWLTLDLTVDDAERLTDALAHAQEHVRNSDTEKERNNVNDPISGIIRSGTRKVGRWATSLLA